MAKKLIETDEPATIVQILLGIMFASWPVAGITAFFNSDVAQHILVWPIVLLALVTINGTPCKKKWVEVDEEGNEI